MSVKIADWDGAEFLTTPERIAAYLDVVLEEGDPDMIKIALGNIARSKGMTEIERTTGIRRTTLYRALSPDGNPELATVASVLDALGLRLSVVPKEKPAAAE
jgi:probable addiction module antidote protein